MRSRPVAILAASAAIAALALAHAAAAAVSQTPKHVLLGMHQLCYEAPCYHAPQRVPLERVATWISWALADPRVTDEARRLGMRTYAYLDPSIQYDPHRDDSPLYSDDPSTFLHGCDGKPAMVRRGNLDGFLMDQGAPSYRARVRALVDRRIRGHYDALFVDDVFAATDTWAKVLRRPCSEPFELERAKSFGLWQDLAMPIIFNKLGDAPDDGRTDAHGQAALNGPNVIGAMYEFCLSSGDDRGDHTLDFKRVDGAWLSAENSQIQTVAQNKLFFCNAGSETPAATPQGIDQRTYVYASFLLTYRLDRSVLEMSPDTTPSRVPAFPESELVAMDPTRPEPGDVRALRAPGGAFVREYRRCALAGRDVGPCAAVVNPSSSASATLTLPAFRHALSLHGGALADGGTVAVDAPAPATLARATGTILFR